MAFLRIDLKFLVLIQVVIMHLFPKHMSQATATNNCTSAVSPTDACNKITYEQVYNILAKSENSFNIESALYPPKRPSSVRVSVNVYGPNKTESSTPAAKYTWSISCLYAALPAKVLEFWSLWSIMVTSRTQELNITISLSCCDVTKGKLKKHIEDALAALQDLAVRPAMRDPQLNSAECITEGHQPSISSVTEHSWRITSILILSFLFSTVFGPLLAFTTTRKQDELEKNGDNNRKNTIDFLCAFLFVTFTVLIIARYVTVHTSSSDKKMVPYYMFLIIELIQPFIVLAGAIVFLGTWVFPGRSDQNIYSVKEKSLFFIISANLATYHFCWLLVGIMLNPIWGLVALLVLCLFIGISTFSFYTYMSSNDALKCQSFSSCFGRFLAICGLIVTVILAGQSYNGRQTADEALKKAVMYLISISFSWLYWKGWVNKSKKSADCPSGLVLAPNSSHENCHAPEQSGTEMETLVRQDVQIISV